MGRHEAMIAIGVGCRKGCPAQDIVALVREALATLPAGALPSGLFTIEAKRGEPGLAAAAEMLGLPLAYLEKSVLQNVAADTKTHSPRIAAMHGVPSVAETAALAGAGPGAVLIVPRRATPRATCAIAATEAPDTTRGARAPLQPFHSARSRSAQRSR